MIYKSRNLFLSLIILFLFVLVDFSHGSEGFSNPPFTRNLMEIQETIPDPAWMTAENNKTEKSMAQGATTDNLLENELEDLPSPGEDIDDALTDGFEDASEPAEDLDDALTEGFEDEPQPEEDVDDALTEGFEDQPQPAEDLDDALTEGFEDDPHPTGDAGDALTEGFDEEALPAGSADTILTEEFEDERGLQSQAGQETEAPPSERIFFRDFTAYFSSHFDGYLRLSTVYNFMHDPPVGNETDWRGFSSLRGDVQLVYNTKFFKTWQLRIGARAYYDFIYDIKGYENYESDLLESYRDEVELGEAYILGSLTKKLDVKIGRQIVVWGKSDALRVTDILNPIDGRFPGITTDIEDLRLPVFMARFDYYLGRWDFTGILIPEIRLNKYPEFGSDFSDTPPPDVETPSGTEMAFSINRTFGRTDVSFYLADAVNDTPNVGWNSGGFFLEHSRLQMIGAALSSAMGEWLLKAEAAYFDGLEYEPTSEYPEAAGKNYTRTDILAGLEFYGFQNTTLIIELVNRHLNNYDESLENGPQTVEEDEYSAVFGLTRTFLNELLSVKLFAAVYGWSAENGSFLSFTADYDITDAIEISGGALFFQPGELTDWGDNDRLVFSLKYNF